MRVGEFRILGTAGRARTGEFMTRHGIFETPAFMPVGTQGTVKGVTPAQLQELGAQIVLSNTYHLHLRPGDELIRDLGGLHKFMAWDGPILTDSGGFQVFSLAKLRKLSERGVKFQSHIDGREVEFTPESVVRIQENLGVDIMMVLDECLPYPATREQAATSLAITLDWAARSQRARTRREEVLAFGIVQGGMYEDLRQEAARAIAALDFDGIAIGGLSVGEPIPLMYQLVDKVSQFLPREKVHYLMGVGTPSDIIEAIRCGIDMFDCVIPTRSARFGRLYTETTQLNIRNTCFRNDPAPIEEGCDCYACQHFSRAYIGHLVHAKEILGVELATIHNLRFYQRLVGRARKAIREGAFQDFSADFLAKRQENITAEEDS